MKSTKDLKRQYRLTMPRSMKEKRNQTKEGCSFKQSLTRYNRSKEREKALAEDRVFRIDGQIFNRYEVMEYIIRSTYEGLSLPDILQEDEDEGDRLPMPHEVMGWFEFHPRFRKEFEKAEKYRAEVLANDGMKTVRQAKDQLTPAGMIDKNYVAYAKLFHDTSIQQASFLSEKFQTKTQVKQETKVSDMTEDQVKAQLATLLNDPAVRGALDGIVDLKALECATAEVPSE